MDNSLVSVIIPIFNKDKSHVKKCVQSILNQSLKNIQIIIINDGSTNAIEDLLENFSLKI